MIYEVYCHFNVICSFLLCCLRCFTKELTFSQTKVFSKSFLMLAEVAEALVLEQRGLSPLTWEHFPKNIYIIQALLRGCDAEGQRNGLCGLIHPKTEDFNFLTSNFGILEVGLKHFCEKYNAGFTKLVNWKSMGPLSSSAANTVTSLWKKHNKEQRKCIGLKSKT